MISIHHRLFPHETPENWSIQASSFAYAQISEPLQHLHI